jgi:diaminopimelate epimerase
MLSVVDRIPLAKLHATGNDFLVWTMLDGSRPIPAALARALCDRHAGVGADGLILLTPGADGADATMTLHNADGGIAEMSGNGIRALAWAAVEAGLGGDTLVVDTGGGRRTLAVERGPDGRVARATVDMGPVTFDPAAIPVDADSPFDLTAEVHGVTYRGDAAGMGNPHLVCFVDDVAAARVVQHGPHLETDPRFPRHTNVEFVAPDGVNALRMRVWERGVGETRSCGTGACAAAAVAHRRDLVGPRVIVRVPGGELTVEVADTIRLGGPVVHVFDVEVDPDALDRGDR